MADQEKVLKEHTQEQVKILKKELACAQYTTESTSTELGAILEQYEKALELRGFLRGQIAILENLVLRLEQRKQNERHKPI